MIICIQCDEEERTRNDNMIASASARIDVEHKYENSESELNSASDSPDGVRLHVDFQHQDEQLDAPVSTPRLAHAGHAAHAAHSDQSEEKARRWMWGFLIALGAMQLYFVQEMLAALFLFTLAFAVFAVIAFALYAANRASQASLARVEPYARVAARAGRRTYGFIEHVSKRPFRRPHSETAQ